MGQITRLRTAAGELKAGNNYFVSKSEIHTSSASSSKACVQDVVKAAVLERQAVL